MLLPVMTPVEILVNQCIQRSGPISFARFMDLALYCPEVGFYDRFPHRIGARGDFYTSVSVGPLFGQLLGAQFAHWLERSKNQPCQIVEGGAHDGQLARDLLAWLQSHDLAVYQRLEYWLVEPSPRRQQWQAKTLAPFAPRVRWADSWSTFSPGSIHGIVFANELLDAFPVHRLGWSKAEQSWFEWGVDQRGDKLVWTRLPKALSKDSFPWPELPVALREQLPDGFTMEICPDAIIWWQQAAKALRQGRLLTLDYGLRAEEFLDPGRAQGTVRAYHRHRLNADLLAQPGEQDLTAHVNFTALEEAGLAAGLRTEHCTSQGRFLSGIVVQHLQDRLQQSPWSIQERRQFQTLTHPEHLGTRHQVLVQTRSGMGQHGLSD
jgi:SAM-dependent MidA family methyltransferase